VLRDATALLSLSGRDSALAVSQVAALLAEQKTAEPDDEPLRIVHCEHVTRGYGGWRIHAEARAWERA
jgi:hypothetical protein